MAAPPAARRAIMRTVFFALLVDIFSFTVILPLLPRLLDYYRVNEAQDPASLFSKTLAHIHAFKHFIGGSGSSLDVVLFGGAIGSLFSFLQFVASPMIGRMSDTYGRKRVLMLCMMGNLASCFLWVVAKPFWVFVASRVVGGLSEGNVQLSIAIISDITTPETRSRGLALVGIAFALGFTFGPALGAYLATHYDLAAYAPVLESWGLNPYSASALFAFVLILVEIVYLQVALPETLPASLRRPTTPSDQKKHKQDPNAKVAPGARRQVMRLSWLHFGYLFLFSGLEFTLPFLTYDRFAYTNMEQGKLFAYIGVITAAVQGGYTRRAGGGKERRLVVQGIVSCAAGFAVLALWPRSHMALYVAATFLAFTSATVVTGLTALASLACGAAADAGLRMGTFRSLGQLGRAAGPMAACAAYWLWGAQVTYLVGSAFLMVLAVPVAMLRAEAPSSLDESKKAQ